MISDLLGMRGWGRQWWQRDNTREVFCGDRTVPYLDPGGGCMNLYTSQNLWSYTYRKGKFYCVVIKNKTRKKRQKIRHLLKNRQKIIILLNFPFPFLLNRKQFRQRTFRFNTLHVCSSPTSIKVSMQLESPSTDVEQITGGKDRLSES